MVKVANDAKRQAFPTIAKNTKKFANLVESCTRSAIYTNQLKGTDNHAHVLAPVATARFYATNPNIP